MLSGNYVWREKKTYEVETKLPLFKSILATTFNTSILGVQTTALTLSALKEIKVTGLNSGKIFPQSIVWIPNWFDEESTTDKVVIQEVVIITVLGNLVALTGIQFGVICLKKTDH